MSEHLFVVILIRNLSTHRNILNGKVECYEKAISSDELKEGNVDELERKDITNLKDCLYVSLHTIMVLERVFFLQ